ncbi:MAG: NAD(P)H-hydrate dehydratase [Firmicutes bacterium]|nr:NAD(P)H-hydrate dehydratase [[Eubacterium] siraeum]MCM1488622.1 NAD(P)H-hydrate dehydratase [Bacillota bacterium]
MTFIVNTEQMINAELNSEKEGISRIQLMKNAAKGCFKYLKNHFSNLRGEKFVILCGKGNNGGDGVELASVLTENGGKVTVILTDEMPGSETAKECRNSHSVRLNTIKYSENKAAAEDILSAATIIIDCVFGTGFHGELSAGIKELFDFIAKCKGYKISVDIPSGINGNTGIVTPHSFKADATLVLAAMKTGLLNSPAFDHCGEVKITDIGISDDCYTEYDGALTDGEILGLMPSRPKSANKGTFGRLLNVAGGGCYLGAALLSSKGALKIGTGLVTLASVKRVIAAAAPALPECIYEELPKDKEGFISDKALPILGELAEKATAVTIGCGMGNRSDTKNIVGFLLKKGKCPVILDADGINSIADNINVLKDNNRPIILTPHPGELGRLLHKSVGEIQADRLNIAKGFAKEYGVVLLLKGNGTVIAAPDGRVMVNTTGNNALAKAGCGDVLTGIVGGLAAQGVDPFAAAVLGAYLHGLSADILIQKQASFSVMASDVAEGLGRISMGG